jgi:sialate O-acetylesterase
MQNWLDEATLDKVSPNEPRFKPTSPRNPVVWYNGTVAPVQKFPVKGIIWYQGESNSKDPFSYLKLFTALIRQWRAQWGEGDIPFYWMQLASHGVTLGDKTGESWAWLREAQSKARSEPNTGMATALDIGEFVYIHPSEKRIAAQRLAAVALHGEGHPVPFEGPRFQTAEFSQGRATLHFATDSKLRIEQVIENRDKGFDPGADPNAMKSPADALTGFVIAGADQHFVPADAKITGDATVVVSSPKVPDPKAVRYGWADFSLANLYNANGFPAEPFRTDDWPPSAALLEQAKSVLHPPGALKTTPATPQP